MGITLTEQLTGRVCCLQGSGQAECGQGGYGKVRQREAVPTDQTLGLSHHLLHHPTSQTAHVVLTIQSAIHVTRNSSSQAVHHAVSGSSYRTPPHDETLLAETALSIPRSRGSSLSAATVCPLPVA
jgi:hypothetical protein